MSNPSTLDLIRSLTFDQYVEFVTIAFTEYFDRMPNGDVKSGVRFWYDINVHPVSAALMLPDWGY